MQTALLTPRQAPIPAASSTKRRARLPLAPVTAAIAAGAWLLAAPRTPDLAAQAYRLYLFQHAGFVLWDNSWYGGHHIPGYSLLYPPLASLLGMRLLGALAVLASASLFERIVLVRFGARALGGAVLFALAAACDLWVGRIAFALGVSFALAAVAALAQSGHGRAARPLAALCALLCAAASPVAGAMLCLAAVSYGLIERRLRPALLLMLPVLLLVGLVQALFPEGGYEPFPAGSVAASIAATLAFLWAVPKQQRLLYGGALIYLGVELLCLIHTPMGSNIERYGVLLAAPLLLCAIQATGGLGAGPKPAWALLCALVGLSLWTIWGPITQTRRVAGDPSTSASFYVPLERFLASHGGQLQRIEVPFTRSHWEAALLAPYVELARGWDKQLDKRYDAVLENPHLTASAYERWLDHNAVSYVALPAVPLDVTAIPEAALLRHGLPFLRQVFDRAGWRVYRVLKSTPLLQGQGRLLSLGHDTFTLLATRPGVLLVRVHYTPWWTVTSGAAKVSASPGGWTHVIVSSPGQVTVTARFSLGKALTML